MIDYKSLIDELSSQFCAEMLDESITFWLHVGMADVSFPDFDMMYCGL